MNFIKQIKTIINNSLNKLKRVYSNIKYICKTYKWFNYMFQNPFSIWCNKSVRQIFILPNIKFKIHNVMYEPSFADAIFGLYTVALSWKSKYGEPRYEDDPFIQLNLFGICFKLQFVSPTNDGTHTCMPDEAYWESILDYYGKLYENKTPNLYKIINKNTWLDPNGKEYDTTVILTHNGFFTYLNERENLKLKQNHGSKY